MLGLLESLGRSGCCCCWFVGAYDGDDYGRGAGWLVGCEEWAVEEASLWLVGGYGNRLRHVFTFVVCRTFVEKELKTH